MERSAAPTILYRDAHLVAVDKPPGALVHRTRIDAHADRLLVQEVRDAVGRRVWPVHRLDKGTSGVLLLALDLNSARALAEAFATGGVTKHYLALVRGWPPPAGRIEHALAPRDDDAEGMSEDERRAAAQPALTDFVRLATAKFPVCIDRYPETRYALLDVRPRTGRRHQIRRHLKHIAHPVLGDATFGKGVHNRFVAGITGTARLWLHAHSLTLPHPRDGSALTLEAPPAQEWRVLPSWPEWRWDSPADAEAAQALARLVAQPERGARWRAASDAGAPAATAALREPVGQRR
jgi:tRNA pseudouridine65 synthase